VAGRTPLVPRLQVAIPLPPGRTSRPAPKGASDGPPSTAPTLVVASLLHLPHLRCFPEASWAVGRRHVPRRRSPPRSGVVALGVLPPRRLLSPQARLHIVRRHLPSALAARGFMVDARRASVPRVGTDGFTEVVRRKRQASRSPPRVGSRSPPSSPTGVPEDLLGKCFNCFGLNHVTAHCFHAPLLQLLSTRTSQELLPVAVHGSSYSYVPARSARLWLGMCPASASSTPGSRGAAAPWGASSPPG
jgi:hypothetical protein